MQTITSVGKKILDTMPLPIALAWKTVVRAQNASEQVRQCWALLDVYLRYTSGILVAAYLRGEPDETVEQCLKDMEKPSLGHYCALIRAILKPIHGTDHFFSHVADWHFTNKGKPTEDVRLLHDLVTERNRDSHGAKPTEAALEEKSRDLKFRFQALLRSSNWLIGYTLFRVSEINTRSRGRQNGLIHRYHGDTMTPIPGREKWCCTSHGGVAFLQEEAMYLSHPEGTYFLEVTPFLWVDLAQNQEPIFLWVSTPKGKRIESRCDALEDKQDMLPMIEENRYAWSDWLAHRTELDPIFQNTEVARFIASEFKEIGQLLDKRFRIEARLGEGGMATVYHAVDTYMDKAIALKVLHLEQADTTVKERMKLEAKMMKRLDHPNILKISELIDLSDNRLALSMPMMSGTLKDLLTHQKVTEELVQVWAGQLVSALQYLHSQESPIIHRDIKPSNVLYNDAGEVFLADFGIAFQNSGDVRLTRTAEQLGSLPYMAKELQLGEEATPATDLYALGVTLYELLMGDLPSDTLSLDSNNGFHQFVANLLDSNPEVRLQAQWGVVAKVEEVETETTPSVESKSKWSNFSKRLFSQFKRSLGDVAPTLEASATAEPIDLSEDRKAQLVEHLVQQVLEQHGVDVSPHIMCMNRLSDAINTIGTPIQHGQNIQIDLPHFIYGPQGDIHFQYTMTFEMLQDFFIEPEVDVAITPDDIKSILIDWVVSSVQSKHEVDLREHSMVMTRIQDTIHTLVDSDEGVKNYTVDLPHLFYGSAGAIHFKEEISLQAVKTKFLEAQPEIDLSADEQKEVLVSWILKTFESQHGIDLSLEAMCMTRINGEVTQHLEEIQQGQGIHLELPYLYYSSAGAFNFQEDLSASDLRKLFAEYHEQKNTFDVEAVLEKVNRLFHARKMDQLIEELKQSELASVPRCNTIRGYLHLWQCSSIERNVEEAERLLILAVDEDPMAQYWLAKIYLDGMGGMEKDPEKGISLIRRAVEGGYGPAIKRLEIEYRKREDIEMADQLARQFVDLMNTGAYDDQAEYLNSLGGSYQNGLGVEQDLDRAFGLYKRAAELGSPYAQYLMGLCYEVGTGVEPDDEKMFSWYLRAAEQGDADAMWQVGRSYELAYGVEMDEKKAIEWYQKALNEGNAVAAFALGEIYRVGNHVVEPNPHQAFKYFLVSAKRGYPLAQVSTGLCLEWGEGVEMDTRAAFGWYKESASAGIAHGLYRLGLCYEFGVGTDKHAEKAFNCFLKASTDGDPQSQFRLAMCYDFGAGTQENKVEAIKWYLEAAEQGQSDAQIMLAHSYADGDGIPRDASQAFYWFSKAEQNGSAEGTYWLGRCFEEGIGTEINSFHAFNKYKEAAMGDVAAAQYKVGQCYQSGYGTAKDDAIAIFWYKEAAEKGQANAQYLVGNHYLNDQKQPEEAFKWYSLAAEQGVAVAEWTLGMCFEYGWGTESHRNQALYWYERAASQNVEEAQDALDRLEGRTRPVYNNATSSSQNPPRGVRSSVKEISTDLIAGPVLGRMIRDWFKD